MSSKGSHVAGTDGSDFTNRETVAPHYKVSAQAKSWLHFANLMHMFLGVLMLLRLSGAIIHLFGVPSPLFLRQLNLPVTLWWEVIWVFSLAMIPIFNQAARKNNVQLITNFFFGIVVLGFIMLIIGAFDLIDEAKQYFTGKQHANVLFLGFPFVILWYIFIIITLQVHVLQLHFAWKLKAAWKTTPKKKT